MRLYILLIFLFHFFHVTAQENEYENLDSVDTIQLSIMLAEMLKIASQNLESDYNFKELDWNWEANASGNLTIGHLFSKHRKHLLVRRFIRASTVLINIYLIDSSTLKMVCRRIQDGMTYLKDTIQDVNGDNEKDFLVHWYPSSGCCRRNTYNVYLYKNESGTFTNDYQFINPTFFSSEKVIRGVKYGHTGHVGLYKYKWNDFQIDTMEYIYPYDKQFIKTKHQTFKLTKDSGQILISVPPEYLEIKDFDWFINYRKN
jgi:hypothetical protein